MPDWNQLVEDVAQVRFFYGDPTMFFIFQGYFVRGLQGAVKQ